MCLPFKQNVLWKITATDFYDYLTLFHTFARNAKLTDVTFALIFHDINALSDWQSTD